MAERNPYSRPEEFDAGARRGSTDPGSGGITDEARERAGEMAERAQGVMGETTEKFKERASSSMAGQKDRAAGGVESIAHAIRQTGQQLREQDQGTVAEYAERAATEMERLSMRLRESDVSDLVGEVERFARRQPALFLGGAMLLGFMGARFLRSTNPDRDLEYPPSIYGQDQFGSRWGTGPGRNYGSSPYDTSRETGYRDPAVFRPRGSILPREDESTGTEGPAGTGEPRGTIHRWPAGETPGQGPSSRPGASEELEDN